jgi:hypothetical protein
MAEIKVTQLASTLTLTPTDILMVIQNGVNKKISVASLLKNLNSDDTIRFNPTQNAIDVVFSSNGVSNLLFVDGVNDRIGIGTSTPSSTFHVNIGNVQVGSTTTDGVFVGSSEIITHPPSASVTGATISPLRETTALEIYGSCTYTLGSGTDGQTKNIYLKAIDTGGSTATITVDGLGFNRIGLSTAIGDALTLKYLNSKWVCVGNNGATLSTV